MRTTLDLPGVRRRRLDDLKNLMGRVQLEIDLPASRRRPRPER
jgi:hypothetical protein